MHYGLRTEQNHVYWARWFIRWHGLWHPKEATNMFKVGEKGSELDSLIENKRNAAAIALPDLMSVFVRNMSPAGVSATFMLS